MRRGEILGLRWSDIDLKAARLTVNQSLERLAGKTVFKPPKTAGSRRTITLPALTVEALSAHRAEQARIGAGELAWLRKEIADQVGAKSVPIGHFRKGRQTLSD
jgi:integrase